MPRSLPTADNVALLQVIFSPVDETHDAWTAWAQHVDIDNLTGAQRLLPALYKKLEATGQDHPWMGRLKGIYRRRWTETQLHRAALDAATSSLTAAGIDFLSPADEQMGRFLEDPATYPLQQPRVTVDWWSAPAALAALTSDGWRIDEKSSPGNSVRGRLTRTRWYVFRGDGHAAEIVNMFNPHLRDEQRDADVWERARAATATAPPLASADDVFVAALTDELHGHSPVIWTYGCEAMLRSDGEALDLRPILDRRAARRVLPVVVSRLEFLTRERQVPQAERLLADARDLAGRHRLPASLGERTVDWGRQRARALTRQPTAAREIVDRFGGLTGVKEYLGSR